MTELEARLYVQMYKLNCLILFFSEEGFLHDQEMYTRLIVAKKKMRQLILTEANKQLQPSKKTDKE